MLNMVHSILKNNEKNNLVELEWNQQLVVLHKVLYPLESVKMVEEPKKTKKTATNLKVQSMIMSNPNILYIRNC